MLRSLGVKIGLLLATTLAISWIGWEEPFKSGTPPLARHSPTQKLAPPLDLNRATVEELTALPGVGEVIAKRIIEHRKNIELYESPQQLLDVRGIGETRLARLHGLVQVSRDGAVEHERLARGDGDHE